jgi:hypothetical protein
VDAGLAYLRASPAQGAPVAQEDDLRAGLDRLGAVAPPAPERAALQVYRHADAGPVVDGERVEVEDEALGILDRAAGAHERASWRRMWWSCCSRLSIVK